jgi:hypothetical protein
MYYRLAAMLVREIECKSILSDTGLPADYAINCYVGCGHACRYCYARFMKRFMGHREPWGTWVDVRTNAPGVLAREIRRKPRGSVMLSPVSDGPSSPAPRRRWSGWQRSISRASSVSTSGCSPSQTPTVRIPTIFAARWSASGNDTESPIGYGWGSEVLALRV